MCTADFPLHARHHREQCATRGTDLTSLQKWLFVSQTGAEGAEHSRHRDLPLVDAMSLVRYIGQDPGNPPRSRKITCCELDCMGHRERVTRLVRTVRPRLVLHRCTDDAAE